MAKRDGKHGHDADARTDDNLVLERLRRHLAFLGLTLTLDELDERLAWGHPNDERWISEKGPLKPLIMVAESILVLGKRATTFLSPLGTTTRKIRRSFCMPAAFAPHRVIDEPEARCLQAEARCLQAEARCLQGRGAVPSGRGATASSGICDAMCPHG